jgi:hypothetical protein
MTTEDKTKADPRRDTLTRDLNSRVAERDSLVAERDRELYNSPNPASLDTIAQLGDQIASAEAAVVTARESLAAFDATND